MNIIPFYNMIVNYDKENGWGIGGLFDLFTGSNSKNSIKTATLFNNGIKELGNDITVKKINALASSIGNVDESLVQAAINFQTGNGGLKEYNEALAKATTSTSKFSKIGSTIKNVLGTVGATALNVAAVWAVSKAIEAGAKAWENYSKAQENAIEEGQVSVDNMKENQEEIKSAQDLLDSIKSDTVTLSDGTETTRFEQLSKGVNSLGQNVSLTKSEFEEYNSLLDQMSSVGFTATNSMSNLENQMKILRQSANFETIKGLGDWIDSFNAKNNQMKTDSTKEVGYQQKISALDKIYADPNNKADTAENVEKQSWLENLGGKYAAAQQMQAASQQLTEESRQMLLDSANEIQAETIQLATDTQALEDIAKDFDIDIFDDKGDFSYSKYTSDKVQKQLADARESLIANVESEVQQSSGYLQALFENNPAFSKVSDSVASTISGIFTNIDYDTISSYMMDSNGNLSQSMMKDWVDGLTKNISKDGVQEKLDKLFALDTDKTKLTFSEYKKQANDLINSVSDAVPELSKSLLKKSSGFDDAMEELEADYNKLTKMFGKDKISGLSNENLEIAADIVANDQFSGTFDELLQKIYESKKALTDLDANPLFDAIATADETKNAGDDYVKSVSYAIEAEEMYNKHLIGTDDFKTRAAYFSPTGADDAVNFAENLPRIKRYMTEDGAGIQNFLYDLRDKGFAKLTEAVDENGNTIQQWDYNIQDLEQSAKDMGMSFDWFMDMFGRLEDYGFSNNFVSSVEDGATKITDLSTQLVDAQAELERLKASGADSTAIKQQEAKVAGLKHDIQETQEAMSQVAARSADDYKNQVETAKTAITSLKAERDKILKDNTYGDNTDEIVALMDNQIKEWASDNGIQLDADLNIVNKEEIQDELNSDPIKIDVDYSKLDELKEKAEESLSSVQELVSRNSTVELNLDSGNIQNIGDQINGVQYALQGLQDEDGTINMDSSQVQACLSVMDALYAQKLQLEGGIIMSVDTSGLDDGLATAISTLQEFQSTYNELQQAQTLQAAGIDVDTSEAETKIQTLASQIQGLDTDTKASLGINTEEFDAAIAKLSQPIEGNVSIDTSALDTASSKISEITNQDLNKAGVVSVTVNGKGKVDDLSTSIKSVKSKDVSVTATTTGKSNVDALSASISSLSNRDIYVTTYTQTVDLGTSSSKQSGGTSSGSSKGRASSYLGGVASGTMLSPARASGTAYNVLNYKSAFANGKVALSRDEEALVNEMGTESLIRNGVWSLIPGGMHTQALKKGDIVLNASQTADLLKTGKAIGHGKAYAGGSGGGNFFIGGAGSQSGMSYAPSYSARTPKSSTASTKAVQQATQAATKATEDFFDFVEIYLDRAKDITDKATDSIEDATNLADKMSANSTALTKIQSEISANQQAYNRYMAQVNSVGLSENYASQIRNGSLNIENITDETLKKNIESYKKYYELSKDASDAVIELQRKEKELARERLEYIEDTYDAITKVHKSVQDINDSQLEYEEAMGFNNVSDSVKKVLQSSVDEQQKIYGQNLQRLTDYQNEFNSLVSNGYLKEGSEEYNEAKAQLNDFIKEVNESATALIEFQDKLNEVEYKKIQNLIDGFDRAVSKLDKWVSLQESRDNDVPESTYQEQIDTNNANIKENYNLRNEKLKEQALYDVNSKRYQELAEDINKIDEETLGLLADNEKLKNSIFELRFKPLDDAIEKYDKLSDELGDFYDLLNEDAFFTKQGGGTADLVAGLALISQQIEVNKQKIADYRVGLDKLQESFDNGVISEKEFNEKSEEYISGVQNAAKANNSLSNSITDLYLKQIKAENDYLQESIDKHKELLNQRKESDAYEKKVKSQTKNINALKSQIQALEGTNNQQSQAELKRLRAQLQEAEDELTETRTDHQYDVREHGYNALSDSLNEMYKDTEYAVTHSAEKQQEVIQSMLNTVVSSYASAYEKINQIITNTGWIGSSDFNSNQDELNTQNGANNQVNNAIQKPINTKPSDIANNTVTTPINSNDKVNAGIEHEIMQKPNTTNRPVAELKVSPTSISLEEGKSATIKASIRPTDAANKTLSWGTSNESVATCANGTVKAIKPGSCQILVSTTDGSGITQNVSVTVTKKPDPPKPAPRPSSGGDGIPRVGDRVTLKAGQSYFYDSWGTRPAGSLYNGVPNGVIIDGYSGAEYGGQSTMHGGFGVHIKGADGVYGDLGWVRLDQLEGYASGTEYVDKEKLAWTQENKPEIIIRKKDGAMLTKLNPGDKVMDGKMTENIWKLAKNYPNIMNAQNLGINLNHTIPDVEVGDRDASIVNHYDSLLTVNGNVDRDTLPELKQILKESYDYTVKNLVKDARLMGKHKSI